MTWCAWMGDSLCTRLCVYAFGIIQIVVYDVGGCHMSVVIDLGEVDCFFGCVMNFMMFLAYFWDNNQDIITRINRNSNIFGPTMSDLQEMLLQNNPFVLCTGKLLRGLDSKAKPRTYRPG